MAPKAVRRVRAKKAGESVPPPTIESAPLPTSESVPPPTMERGTSGRSNRNTTASRGGGNNTQRNTTASRGAGNSTKRKIPSTPEEALDFAYDIESGDDSYDDVEVQVEDIDLAREKAVSDQKFVHLKNFLIKEGMDAEHPYKDAMRKLLLGQVTTSRVCERIVKYIQYKLTAVQKYLFELLLLDDWNSVVAGDIAELMKNELIEHLEVEVTEVDEIYRVAEEVRRESYERLQLARGEFLKDRVRSWYYNTMKLDRTLRKWVNSPTPSFSSCDVPYDSSYDQY